MPKCTFVIVKQNSMLQTQRFVSFQSREWNTWIRCWVPYSSKVELCSTSLQKGNGVIHYYQILLTWISLWGANKAEHGQTNVESPPQIKLDLLQVESSQFGATVDTCCKVCTLGKDGQGWARMGKVCQYATRWIWIKTRLQPVVAIASRRYRMNSCYLLLNGAQVGM